MSNVGSKISAIRGEKGKKRALTTDDIGWIGQEEVANFLKIFSSLINKEPEELSDSAEKGKDSENGVADVVPFTASRLSELLQCDIDSFKLPKLLK